MTISRRRAAQPRTSNRPLAAATRANRTTTGTADDSVGMTTDQVQAALGKPEKIFNLGTKQIYTYKDIKITFLDGKVSDVQ